MIQPVLGEEYMYINIRSKFMLCLIISLVWVMVCIYLAQPWIRELSGHVPLWFAVLAVYGIAIIPGFMYAFVASSLLFDHRPPLKPLDVFPAISILIPDYNESRAIVTTIASIKSNAYPGPLEIIVIDDGSTDDTPAILAAQSGIRVIRIQHAGKAAALNAGCAAAQYDLIVSLDSDTLLWHHALRNIVERLYSDPPSTAAVAGAVLVRNSRENLLTRLQEWDYFHGIGSVKRMQSLFQGTLVVQGAFSLYRKSIIEEAGGWKNSVGEDIVLTWGFLCKGYRTGFAENAVSFTSAPATYRNFYRQRKRWARGMIEGFKHHPCILFTRRYSLLFVLWNTLFPVLDAVYLFVFVPGVVLALFGYFFIAGPLTLLVLPLAFLVNYVMFSIQNQMFYDEGLKVRRNIVGLILYVALYQTLLVPASVAGYCAELLSLKKSWGSR